MKAYEEQVLRKARLTPLQLRLLVNLAEPGATRQAYTIAEKRGLGVLERKGYCKVSQEGEYRITDAGLARLYEPWRLVDPYTQFTYR
jgi:hypothetical protein